MMWPSHTLVLPSLFRGIPLMILCRLLGPLPRRVVMLESICREFCMAPKTISGCEARDCQTQGRASYKSCRLRPS